MDWLAGFNSHLLAHRIHIKKERHLGDNVPISDRVDAVKTTAAEIEAKKRERRCTICDGKKEIIFENEYSRICKECMDELRNREVETL